MNTSEFNSLDYLESNEEIAAYLNAALHDEDPNVFKFALADVVKHIGVTTIAERTGLGRESLYKTIRAESRPRWETVCKILVAVGAGVKIAA